MLKADLHIHTEYSVDSNMRLETIISRCLEKGIDCVAIADHGTIAGALRMREIAPFTVIVAEEILTPSGEVMGMFLEHEIPSGLPIDDTIAQIKAQGGLVCIPHPFDSIRLSALRREASDELMSQVDIIEVFNARTTLQRFSRKAELLAQQYGTLVSAGSDAHTPSEIGNAYVEMPEFGGRDDFCSALAHGEIYGHRSGPWVHIPSSWARLKNRFRD